jgi:hypothetical protein
MGFNSAFKGLKLVLFRHALMRLVKNYLQISNVSMSPYVFPSALRRSMGRSKAQAATVRMAPEVPKRGAYKEFKRKTGNTEESRSRLNCAARGLI